VAQPLERFSGFGFGGQFVIHSPLPHSVFRRFVLGVHFVMVE
jgi:hypothetical protein